MLQVDLRALDEGPVETVANVAPDDPFVVDLEFEVERPIAVRGRLSGAGPGRYFWKAQVGTAVALQCRRCLAPIGFEISVMIEALFTTEPANDDPTVYGLEPGATECDLQPALREELLLAVPDYPLCRDECRGLCAQCGANLNEGPCACRPEPDSRWDALRALQSRDR